MLISFFGNHFDRSQKKVKHMPALQLVAIRQFLGGGVIYISFCLKKNALIKGKQWNTIIILSILNFVLSNALSTGALYISSGLGAIIGACVPVVDCHYFFFKESACLSFYPGLLLLVLVVFVLFFMII
jgi:hypothetical protein